MCLLSISYGVPLEESLGFVPGKGGEVGPESPSPANSASLWVGTSPFVHLVRKGWPCVGKGGRHNRRTWTCRKRCLTADRDPAAVSKEAQEKDYRSFASHLNRLIGMGIIEH
jgi:hypothetical protein